MSENAASEPFDRGANFDISAALHPDTLMPGVSFKGFGVSIIINPFDARNLAMALIDAASTATQNAALVRSLQDDNIDTPRAMQAVSRSMDLRNGLEMQMAQVSNNTRNSLEEK